MNQLLSKKPDETEEEYCRRVIPQREVLGMKWAELADIMNSELNHSYSPDRYRKMKFDSYIDEGQFLEVSDISEHCDDSNREDFEDLLLAIRKERAKLSDERTQINRLARNMAREETLKEIAEEAVKVISKDKVFTPYESKESGDKIGILCLSDVHYGIEVDNAFNKYNCDIAKQRLQKLKDETIAKLEKEEVKNLCVVNMGDLIAGRIHLPIRLNSRIDTVTQTIEMSEIVAEMLYDLSEHFNVHYTSTSDNHSRLEPNKGDSWDMESFMRITDWYLKERCKDFVTFIENEFGQDISTFNVGTYKVAAVHGDLPGDKQKVVIQNLSLMTRTHYDIILTAHLHHPSLDVMHDTYRVSNGSVMGTDSYAEKLRLSSAPSQNLIIMSSERALETLYIITLD